MWTLKKRWNVCWKTLKIWQKLGKINPEFHRNWLLDTLKCVLENFHLFKKFSKHCFAQTLLRFAKQLSFKYLKNGFASCLSSIMETLLKWLWNIYLKCLINAFVRHCLDLRKSYLLDILKTSHKMSWCLGKTAFRHLTDVFWLIELGEIHIWHPWKFFTTATKSYNNHKI